MYMYTIFLKQKHFIKVYFLCNERRFHFLCRSPTYPLRCFIFADNKGYIRFCQGLSSLSILMIATWRGGITSSDW